MIQHIHGILFRNAEVFRVGGVECFSPGRGQGVAILLPFAAVHFEVGLFEWSELAGLVEIVFQFCDVALFAMVASQFIEHLHEDFKDRRGGIAADVVGLLVDVKENTVGWNSDGTRHITTQDLIFDVR